MPDLIAAIDQGTTSSRCLLFDQGGREVARHQLEHEQIFPRPGWVEQDPLEIWQNSAAVAGTALTRAGASAADLVAVGLTNQRETTIVWNRRTGRPYMNAIVWQDTRTDRAVTALATDHRGRLIHDRAGLPPTTYFSAAKLAWVLDHVEEARHDAERGDALFGTVDSWLLWQLTGGPDGGVHATDPSNASRTMLMDLATLRWDDELLRLFDVPAAMLPEIRRASRLAPYGVARTNSPFGREVPITAMLGDQHAATVGQVCFAPGEAKNTYGTGNFVVLNTGGNIIRSTRGLLSTVAYQLADQPPAYGLEGSIAVTGAAVQWLRDQLGIIAGAAEIEPLARQVADNGGIYFVPAFSGLFAPYWRPDARGVIVGLSRYVTNAHLARAALEAICYQTRDVVEAMAADAGWDLELLKVDGGVTVNELCMQLQADILGVPVVRPVVSETTALGAAYAAGLAAGVWGDVDELRRQWKQDRRWEPTWSADRRAEGYSGWQRAVDRTLNWVNVE